MLERVQSPDAINVAIQQIAAEEKALAVKQLIDISAQLAELSKRAKDLVRPIEIDQMQAPNPLRR